MTEQENNYYWMFQGAIKDTIRKYRREKNSRRYLRFLFRTNCNTPGIVGRDIIELIAWKPFVGNSLAILSRQFYHRPFADFPKLPEDLFLWACHDDCWCTDGVERFFRYNLNKIESSFLGNFVYESQMDEEDFDLMTRYLRHKRTDEELMKQEEILRNLRSSYQN